MSEALSLSLSSLGGSRCIQLKRDSVWSLNALDLETGLAERLRTASANDNEPPSQYVDRLDSHWLKCYEIRRMPLLSSMMCLVEDRDGNACVAEGQSEEDDSDGEYREKLRQCSIAVEAYSRAEDLSPGDRKSSEICQCRAPSSDWTRRSAAAASPSPSQIRTNHVVRMAWIDLRSSETPQTQPQTHSDMLNFFRSLLGSSHESSPWVNEAKTSNVIGDSADVVVLIANDQSEFSLPFENFRVGDASPSWYLHGIAQLESMELPSVGAEWWNAKSEGPPAKLHVYKRIPPRDHISHDAPEGVKDQRNVPGCLWETRRLKASDDKFIHRLVSPPYVDFFQEYPKSVHALMDPECIRTFTKEATTIPMWTPWPETHHYSSSNANSGKPWTVFPLCHCFPANDPSKLCWVPSTRAHCPETCRILEETLGLHLRTALFSQLQPGTTLEPHTGWSDLANHVLRFHIPLVIPPGNLCGTWVDGCVETHHPTRPILFDDSKIHRAFNYHPTETRIVLIVDLARPPDLPVGTATGGHSDELDKFIRQMSGS